MPYKDKNSPAAIESKRKALLKWREKNKDSWNEYQRNHIKKDKDGKWRVYLLPNEMYVGQTTGVYGRMCGHRKHGKDTTDYIILHICDSENEALDIEKIYHNIGFKGTHPYRYNKKYK